MSEMNRREFIQITGASSALLLAGGCRTPHPQVDQTTGLTQGANSMLKGIPPIISPELIKILMEMGHGDELVIGDGNFPAATCAQRLIRADGHGVPPVLKAILTLLPLDIMVPKPVALMQTGPDVTTKPPIWEEYRTIVKASGEKFTDFEMVERFAFYERAKKAFAVVATSEFAIYANIILKKGLITG